jgi:metal-sulfur cluster biosynthetic enzyme
VSVTEAAVMEALARVRDPELDEPLPELGFVSALELRGASVSVRLRLPTYFCAPNFAYMMVADAKEAVLAIPGVETASVTLDEHADAETIGNAVAGGQGFRDAFPDGAIGDERLRDLRRLFAGKALLARQGAAWEALRRAGYTSEAVGRMTVGELPDLPEVARYLARRAELGLDVSAEAPVLVLPNGERVPPAALERHLRFVGAVKLSLEVNAGLCRSLLRTRYGLSDEATDEASRR